MPIFPAESGPLEQRLAQVRGFVELRKSVFRNRRIAATSSCPARVFSRYSRFMRYWLDTEYDDDGTRTMLISLAIVAEDGRELYLASSEFDPSVAGAWVREHVAPFLPPEQERRPLSVLRDQVRSFVGEDPKPEFWSVCATADWPLLVRLFGRLDDTPEDWPLTCWDLWQWAMHLNVAELPEHHGTMHTALDDARWHREVYAYLRDHEAHRS